MLHVINKSPFSSNALANCLRFIQPNDVVLLIEDAVIAALGNIEPSSVLTTVNEVTILVLEPDLKARGLLDQVLPNIQKIGYEQFVDLTVTHHPIQSWS